MSEQNAREALGTLTVAECRVLYWRCRGLSCKEVAERLFVAERTVHFHLGNIYSKLGLGEVNAYQRQRILAQTHCPLLQEEIQDPERDCQRARQKDREPVPEPEEEILALVRYDDEMGLVPVASEIAASDEWSRGQEPPPVIVVPQRSRRVPPVLWVVLGIILGMVLVVALWRSSPESVRVVYVTQPPAPTAIGAGAPSTTPMPAQTVETTGSAATETSPPTPQPTQTETPTMTSIPTETPTPRPTMALPFEDNFDGPKTVWQPIFGTWRMINGTYTAGQDGQFGLALVGDERWQDYAVDVDVNHKNWGCEVSVVVRAKRNTYMEFRTNCCLSRLILVVEGNETELAEIREGGLHSREGSSHLRLEVRESIYTAYSNDRQILRVQDTTLESGMAGLASEGCPPYGHGFDNFRVTLQ